MFRLLLILPLFLFGKTTLSAQETDYLRHGKVFCLCSFKRECSICKGCDKQRYMVYIRNHSEQPIKKVTYKFYSDVLNKVIEKEAKIQADMISGKSKGLIYICVPEGEHWAISTIEYEDGSTNKFVVKERMASFVQEADECDYCE